MLAKLGAVISGFCVFGAAVFFGIANVASEEASRASQACDQGVLVLASGQFKTTDTNLSPEQLDNANAIVDIGLSRGLASRDVKIGLMTVMQESNLRQLPYGDRDSLSLFQQRPSVTGGNGRPYWGTAEQIMNRDYTINRFYDEMVRKVPNRDQLRETVVAQTIQVSAFPDAYQKWADEADAILGSSNISQVRAAPQSTAPVGPSSACRAQAEQVNTSTLVSNSSWQIPLESGAYRISSGYGMRSGALHDGLDLAAPSGTPINAVGGGTIIEMRPAPGGGWGNTIVIDHGDGTRTRYAHMVGFANGISQGSRVNAGDLIGYVGTTGNSTGNHLHFTILRNCPGTVSLNSVCDTIDPVTFYGDKGLRF